MSERSRRGEKVIPFIFMLYGVTTVFMLVFSMMLFVHNTYAATNTTISSVKGMPGGASLSDPQILVKSTFSDEDLANLSITYKWKIEDGSDNFDTPLGTYSTGTSPVSPYQYAITGLDNSQTYRVLVEFDDSAVGTTSTVLANLKTYNPLIHNAVSTGSNEDLWTGGWGISSGQYGEFSCSTCHERRSGNIKRIRKDWSDPGLPPVPAALNSATVIFNSTTEFARDDSSDHSYDSANGRICESCHTRTAHHQCDMSDNDAYESDLDHKSSMECVDCHKHSAGFAIGGCSTCHGGSLSGSEEKNFWPDNGDETVQSAEISDSGEHLAHIAVLAQREYGYTVADLLNSSSSQSEQMALCNYCHANPGRDADHAENTTAETRFLQIYDDTVTDVDATFASGSCSQIDCHNNNTVNVSWYGDINTSCTMCHTTGGTVNPTSGLHDVTPSVSGQRHDSSVSGGCEACHTSLAVQSTHIDGTAQDGSGQEAQMGLATFYTQTADDTGTCSNTNCHFEVNSGADGSSDDWAHVWDSTATFYTDATTACGGCHGDWANNWNVGITHRTSAGTSAKHGTGTSYKCKDCHNLEASSGYTFTFGSDDWNPASGEASTHGDGQIQVNNVTGYNATTGYCVNCHTSGEYYFTDTAWFVVSVAGDAITTSCGECHKGGAAPGSISESHTDHGIIDADITDNGAECVICHGNNLGGNYQNLLADNHGNGTIDLLNTRISSYGGGLDKWDASESTCINTCHATDTNPVWDTTATLACDQCHYYEATPASANNTGAGALNGSHDVHFDAAAVTVCTQCHPDNSGETAPYGHIDGSTLLEKSREAIVTDNADMTPLGADFNDGAKTCSNASCHDPSDTGYVSSAWGNTGSGCSMCHSNSNPGTGSHAEHLGAQSGFGVTITCDSCHPSNSGSQDHMDLTKDVEVSYNSVVTTVVNSATLNGCGTNDCHNDGTSLVSGTPADYTWGTPITDCQECHDATAATVTSNAHNEHLDNSYTTVACSDCHTAATAATHINQSVNIDSGEATYSLGAAVAVGTTPDGTCATASCHNQSGGDSVAWNVPVGDTAGTQALTCDSCHYFNAPATSAENATHFAPLSSSHGDHFDSGKVCTQCHGNLPTTTAHIDNKATLADGAVALQNEAGMDWTHASATTDYSLAADNSCGSATNNGLGCHATGTPDWDVAFDSSVCTNCHTNTTTSEVNPTSGLHGATNLLKHDDSFNTDKTCTSCHDASTPSNAHMNGTLQDGGTVTYTWDTTYMAAGYVRATDDCAATCHTDGGTWNREWSGAIDVAWTYSDDPVSDAVCGNCHGSFATGWNIVGNTSHVDPDADNNPDTLAVSAGSHGTCSTCHAWGHTNYTSGTMHENNTLETNSTLGYDNANPDATCSTNCHTGQTLTMKSDSGWTDASVVGDGVTCGGCHTGGVTAGSASGAHTIHGATAASVAADPASIALCVTCHGEDGTGGTHNDGNLDFSGVTYNSAVRNDETGTCTTSSCHNQGSDPSTAWNSSALACDDCHYYEATVADNTKNAAHDASLSYRHDSHFDQGVQCATCHTVPAAEDTDHINGVSDLADKATAAFGEAVVGGSKTITYSSPNCTANFVGLGCHATASSEAWNQAVDTIACTDCHTNTTTSAVNPTSGLHNTAVLTAHDATLSGGSGNPCEKCHTAVPSVSHVDGTLDTPVTWNTAIIPAGYVSATDSCAATCHSDGGTWNREWTGAVDADWAYGDDASSATVCGNCHGSFATGWNIVGNTSHDDPDTDNGADTLATSKDSHAECSSCHAWGHTNYTAGTKHENDLLEMNSTLGYDNVTPDATCTTSCHGGQTLTMKSDSGWTNAFVAGDGVNCSACHGGNYMTGLEEKNFWPDSAAEDSDSGASDNDSGEHLIHMTHLALQDNMTIQNLLDDGNSKALQIAYCERCHGANAGTAAWHAQGDDVGNIGTFQDMDGTADDLAPAGSHSSGTCSNIDCHNNQNVASPGWYDGTTNAPCTMCHNADGNNGGNPVKVDPTSGLHYSATPNGAEIHDDAFTGGGACLSCHTINPSNKHVDGTVHTPDQVTFNFLATASIDVKLNTLSDATDDTCASSCHSDSGNWYRFWTADAFDGTAFDTSSSLAITATIQNNLPARCSVCHGEFTTAWAEGSAHFNMDADNTSSGASHNSQNPNVNPGAACVDCHLYPDHMTPGAGATRHENGLITLTDDTDASDDYTPKDDNEGTRTGVYCAPCHENTPAPADGKDANTFENSAAFVTSTTPVTNEPNDGIEIVTTNRNPEYTCFSGANGCHGDTSNNWWPNIDSTDPVFYPNREGAHYEHGTTIGELLAAQRGRPGNVLQEDRNDTCNFCHPMTWNSTRLVWESKYHRTNTPEVSAVVTDVFGGYIFPGADKKGVYTSGNPSFGGDAWTDIDLDLDGITGFAYQLEPDPLNPGQDPRYPLDLDGEYWQYLDSYKSDETVRHGVCSNVACHSNAPFTPQWYGDEQRPGQITDLVAYTHNQDAAVHDIYEQDAPGTVHLHWTAPGDNGDFNGTAYEYEVYYSKAGVITDGNLASATRAGGAPTVLRHGESQIMVVDGLEQDTDYWFAVVTKDQPVYSDDDHDDIYDTFERDGLRSIVGATATATTSHVDDVMPTFWGVNQAESHDTGGVVNLSWDAARDHTLPINYLVYWSDYSLKTHLVNGETMPTLIKPAEYDGNIYSFNYTDPHAHNYTVYATVTSGMSYQVSGLGSGVLYNFMVRAEDGHDPVGDGTGIGNIDDNTVVAMALSSKLPQEDKETIMYLADGAAGLTHQADVTAPDWSVTDGSSTAAVTFRSSTQLDDDLAGASVSRAVWLNGISFDLHVTNGDRKLPHDFTWEIGYNNGIDGDVPLGGQTVSVGRRASRVMKVGLSSVSGEVDPNSILYFKLTPADTSLTFSWGNDADKGQLLITAQQVNHQPSAPVLGSLSRSPGGYIDITWTPSNDGTPSDGGQVIHYDVFGSADDGLTWPFIIGTNLTGTDAIAGVTWDTVGDGIDHFNEGTYNCKVKVEASDGYLFETANADGSGGTGPGSGFWHSHTPYTSGTIFVDNSQDDEAPAAVTIHEVEHRPKLGSAYLHWIAVGNDGYNHGTRAAYYDIRFRKVADGALTAGNWNAAATIRAEGTPVPGFAGTAEEFELLNMAPDTDYDYAIITCDAGEDGVEQRDGSGDDNCSGLSVKGPGVSTITSGQYYCGICHSTPPDEPDTKGVHREHGYTLEDCAKCHGDGTGPDDGVGPAGNNNVLIYDGRHYDGVINIGWAKDASGDHLMMEQIAPTDTSGVSIDQGSGVIYSDPDGSGGFNSGGPYTGTENTDSGRCSNFISANANGCHGPFNPQWAPDTVEPSPKDPACADCHGSGDPALVDPNASAAVKLDPLYRGRDPYDRIWDCNVSGYPSELVKASPPQANHGGTATTDRYVGAHEKHLNTSFRFAKGDSCRLCHKDTFELGIHADGNVDLIFDEVAQVDDVTPVTLDYTNAATQGVSCSSMNNMYCHDSGANWSDQTTKCNDCHGMTGKSYTVGAASSEIGHVMGQDGVVENCTYCHVAGHPQSPDGITSGDTDALLINNNGSIGINYKSGGIHLKRTYPWGTYTSLAEICWGCHDQNNDGDLNDAGDISEWGTNTSVATGSSGYNFGSLSQKQWTGAVWNSGYGQTSLDPFWYKRGYIQSTHTTDSSGTSKLQWDDANGRYNETADPIDKIRCSNCHDVHDSNLAPGDTMSGRPYLRGTWKSNPYEEDGAPYSITGRVDYAAAISRMGEIPRGTTAFNELGGYYIDQNNVAPGTAKVLSADPEPTLAHYPTSGWTLQSSAGLCVLCHDDNVDEMDQYDDATQDGYNLWLGTNGHSNSALGGAFTYKSNIFDYTHGRPVPNLVAYGGSQIKDTAWKGVVPDMSMSTQAADSVIAVGYRSADTGGSINPMINADYAFNDPDWGATVGGGTDADADQMYHQFSCSKCHNPHASRLPKLMITNCLDIRHNTWDDARSGVQNQYTDPKLDAVDENMPASYFASAANCHRFDGRRSNTTLRGGWNKVTPWAKTNYGSATEVEHKGSKDPSYSTRTSN